jgi:hypothetical protein
MASENVFSATLSVLPFLKQQFWCLLLGLFGTRKALLIFTNS